MHISWLGKIKSRQRLTSDETIFLKFSPSIGVNRLYILLKFWGDPLTHFWEIGVKFQPLQPYISSNGGIWGSKFFSSEREPRGLLTETLGSGNFPIPDFWGNLIYFLTIDHTKRPKTAKCLGFQSWNFAHGQNVFRTSSKMPGSFSRIPTISYLFGPSKWPPVSNKYKTITIINSSYGLGRRLVPL